MVSSELEKEFFSLNSAGARLRRVGGKIVTNAFLDCKS